MKKVKGKCQYQECKKKATTLAATSDNIEGVGCYCDDHYDLVISVPEYVATCPNCNCVFGV